MKLLLLTTFITYILGKCFSQDEIKKNGYFSYKNNAYDLSNYDHPGGLNTLLLTKGKDVGEFFKMDKYKFHITRSLTETQQDLDKIFIGKLCNNTISNENDIYNSSLFIFSIITFSLFSINGILVTYFCKEKEYVICKLYFSLRVMISCIIYIIWWLTLGFLSFFLKSIIKDLGIWISLNIMFGMLPMTRNSIWVTFFKVSYTKLISIHKFISILTNIAVIVKIIAVIYIFDLSFLFSRLESTMGSIASLLIFFMSIMALPIIRKKYFELFYYSHKILLFCITVTSALHYILCFYLILPSFLLYIIDLIVKFIKTYKIIYTKIQRFEFQDENNTKYNLITLVTKRNLKLIDAGSYFFICNKKISKYEFHPVSLVKQQQNTILFCIKDLGNNSWSSKFDENEDNNEIYIQGPYNNFDRSFINNKYKKIILISNGIGITPMINIFEEICNLSNSNRLSILEKINFVWIIPHHSFIEPFKYILDRQKTISKIEIDIKIFITKTSENLEVENNNYNIFYRKPMIESEVTNMTLTEKDVCVLACGSTSLLFDIELVCVNLKIDFYKESFM